MTMTMTMASDGNEHAMRLTPSSTEIANGRFALFLLRSRGWIERWRLGVGCGFRTPKTMPPAAAADDETTGGTVEVDPHFDKLTALAVAMYRILGGGVRIVRESHILRLRRMP